MAKNKGITDQEYINVSVLTRLRTACEVLSDVCPPCCEHIDDKKFKEAYRTLAEMRDKLFKVISIRDE